MEWHRWLVVLWALGLAGSDLWQRRLPNWATFGAMALGLLYLSWAGQSWLGASPATALLALAAGFFVLLPAYIWRLVAAGDVKFLMATGVLAGLALLTRVYLLGMLLSLLPALYHWLRWRTKPGKVPLGFGFGLATALLLLWPGLLPLQVPG